MDKTQEISTLRNALATILAVAHMLQNSAPFARLVGTHLAAVLVAIEAESERDQPIFGALSPSELYDQIWELHKRGGVNSHLALIAAEKWARSQGTETSNELAAVLAEVAWLSSYAMLQPVGDNRAQILACLERLEAHNLAYGAMVTNGGLSEAQYFTADQYRDLISDVIVK